MCFFNGGMMGMTDMGMGMRMGMRMGTVAEREWQNRNGGRTREWPTTLAALIVVDCFNMSG
jgi:hypothetical protein